MEALSVTKMNPTPVYSVILGYIIFPWVLPNYPGMSDLQTHQCLTSFWISYAGATMKYFLNSMNIKNLFGILNNDMNLCNTSYTVSKNLMWIGTWFPHKLPTFNFPWILLIYFVLSFIGTNIVFTGFQPSKVLLKFWN